jgi:hypothetical protein
VNTCVSGSYCKSVVEARVLQPMQTFAQCTFALEISAAKADGDVCDESELDTCPVTSRTWLLLIPESAGNFIISSNVKTEKAVS